MDVEGVRKGRDGDDGWGGVRFFDSRYAGGGFFFHFMSAYAGEVDMF